MNVIGLEEVTDPRRVFEGRSTGKPVGKDVKRTPAGEISLRPWKAVGAIAIVFSAGVVANTPARPPSARDSAPPHSSRDDRFTPLSDAVMDDAWQGAMRLIEEQGHDVSALLKQAGERVDAWRDHTKTASVVDVASNDDDSDDT